MRFSKMHGIGNDYIYVDVSQQSIADPCALAVAVSDRHTGIGGDGLILVGKAPSGSDAHVSMRIFNADGSEAQMCGNGIRCVAKFAIDRGLSTANPLRVHTRRGELEVSWTRDSQGRVGDVEVDMGEPMLDITTIGVSLPSLPPTSRAVAVPWSVAMWSDALERNGGSTDVRWIRESSLEPVATIVSMGNPHIIFWCARPSEVPLEVVGPAVERHPYFPQRINAHFACVANRGEVVMRTWERGSGITQACGTGASAVCVAGVLEARLDRSVIAHLPGGSLRLNWDSNDNRVRMAGPAQHVFDGEWMQ